MTRKTDQELLSILKEYYNKHGRPPRMADFKEEGYPAPITYQRRFGTWNKALQRAGVPLNEKTVNKEWTHWNTEKLVQEFKREYERIKPKNIRDFNKNRSSLFPTTTTIREHKGLTYDDLKEMAGIETFYKNIDHYVNEIKDVIEEEGVISSEEMRKKVRNLKSVLQKLGMSYNELITHLGYDTKFKTPREVKETDEELIDLYICFSENIGRPATSKDLDDDLNIYSSSVFATRFGSLNKLREKAGYETTKRRPFLYSKEYFLKIFIEIYLSKGKITNKELNKVLKEKGTHISTALRYFKTTKTSDIWKIVKKEIKKEE